MKTFHPTCAVLGVLLVAALAPALAQLAPLRAAYGVTYQIVDLDSGVQTTIEDKEENFDATKAKAFRGQGGTFGPTDILVGANVHISNRSRHFTVGTGAQASSPDGNPLQLNPPDERFREWNVNASAFFRDELRFISLDTIEGARLVFVFEYNVPPVTKTSGMVSNGEFRPTAATHGIGVVFDQVFGGPRATVGEALTDNVSGTQTGSTFNGTGELTLTINGKLSQQGFQPTGYNNTAGSHLLRIDSSSSVTIPRYYAASAKAGEAPTAEEDVRIRLKELRITQGDTPLNQTDLNRIEISSAVDFDYLAYVPGAGKSAGQRRGRWDLEYNKRLYGPLGRSLREAKLDMQPSAPGASFAASPGAPLPGAIASEASFTMNVRFGGKNFRLKGRFGLDGQATFGPEAAAFAALAPPGGPATQLRMTLDESTLAGAITITLDDLSGGADEVFTMRPALFTNKPGPRPFTDVPEELLGSYNFELPARPTGDTGLPTDKYPQGAGTGRLKVKANGSVKGTGKLADGTPFSFSTVLLDGLVATLSAKTDGGAGSLFGSFVFREEGPANDFDADDQEIFLVQARQTHEGWTAGIPLSLRGSKYVVPPKTPPLSVLPGLAAPDADGNASFTATALAGPFTKALNIDTKNKVTIIAPGADKLKATINKPLGSLTGSFLDAATGRNVKLNGVVLQKQQRISGYFLLPAESGPLLIQPNLP